MRKILGFIALMLVISSANWAQQPNVLFIAIDDLNDWVGVLKGHPQAKTPNIDRLASQGMLFTNAHCQAPICGPSRASVLTGLYPSTSGNYLQLGEQDIKKSNATTAKAVFLPDYFENHGYKSMGVGKIVHNGDKVGAFDEYGGIFSKYGPAPKKRIKYDPDWFPEKEGSTQTDWGAFPEQDSLMTDFQSAAWAVKKLQQQHEKPFFLGVGFIRPHVPWYVPKKWFDLFPLNDIVTPAYLPSDFDDIPEMGKRVAEAPMMPTTEWLIKKNQWKEVVQAYLACLAFVDEQVGKVLDALEASAHASNTIVVLWSDHGYHLGEKNRFAKQAIWERDTKTPLIIKAPGVKAGSVCKAPVQLVDIYPTLLALCNLPAYTMAEGHSIKPLLDNPSARWKHHAVTVYGIGNSSIRSERYRLIQYEDGSQELYDLLRDPNEWTNLAKDKKYTKTVASLGKSIPKTWAPASKHISYPFNSYFRERYGNK